MNMLSAFLLCFAGMAALALAMERHQRDLLGRRLAYAQWLRPLGWGLLLAALWPLVAAWGGGIGTTAWFAIATLAALLVALGLTGLRARRRR